MRRASVHTEACGVDPCTTRNHMAAPTYVGGHDRTHIRAQAGSLCAAVRARKHPRALPRDVHSEQQPSARRSQIVSHTPRLRCSAPPPQPAAALVPPKTHGHPA
eukprot:2418128-Prymnesium_polylepis.1